MMAARGEIEVKEAVWNSENSEKRGSTMLEKHRPIKRQVTGVGKESERKQREEKKRRH